MLVDGFDAEQVLDVIEGERISFVGLVPTMLVRLLRSPTIRARDFSSLECVLQGAASCPEWVVAGLDRSHRAGEAANGIRAVREYRFGRHSRG